MFDLQAEMLANLMMEDPIRSSDDLPLELHTTYKGKAQNATLTLPNGRKVEGFVRTVRRDVPDEPDTQADILTPSRAANELLVAMAGTDLGAPTAPYIYLQDRDMVFSATPFSGAQSQVDLRLAHGEENAPGDLLRKVRGDVLGAMEPFLRWLQKKDDTHANRVQAQGRGAIIDNALVGVPDERDLSERNIQLARLRSRYGPRAFAYRRARRTMEARIEAYGDDRLEMHAAKVRKAFDPVQAERTLKRRRTLVRMQLQ